MKSAGSLTLTQLSQAAKKITGNTFTARGMPLNIAVTFGIMGLGAIIIPWNCYNLCNGVGKVVMEKDK